ncbi:AAA family ATPase [Sinomicrobium soli]|uniref:AAA family ATPase n=1 Tax=Sinomicrobium sp. N-1-3-6 TaxID=2219864 RepID=UPI000DCC85DC|nr:AAA family ATPase [Sinomicrobium sp. N-1-3-6]RAV28716.1 ATPase [Sinomicrobium sp. N-1-3-6]
MTTRGQRHIDHFFVLTGGPGAGKTTTLLELHRRGFMYMPEVARKIIREQADTGGNALPWGDMTAYRDMMWHRSAAVFDEALARCEKQTVFFDRGLPDTLAYSILENIPVPDKFSRQLGDYRYNTEVFLFPPWKAIYGTDTERKQDFDLAVKTYGVIEDTYVRSGYKTVKVPETSPEQRAIFILNHLNL